MPPPSPPELRPLPESAWSVEAEVVQQVQEVPGLPVPLLQLLPPESLELQVEPQAEAPGQESLVSTEAQLLPPPPLQPLLPP
jgi:hypothetical protein